MMKQSYFRQALRLTIFAIFLSASVFAQQKSAEPEISVIGIKLGNRESAKKILSNYMPRNEDGRAAYYFYSGYGTQVLKLTAENLEDPYFLTEIEVFKVDESYQKKHYQIKEHNIFVTERGIFIGFRQSVAALFTLPGVSREDMIGPKDVVKKKGEPSRRVKEGNSEIVAYNLETVALDEQKTVGQANNFRYAAQYEFYKNKLVKFNFKVLPNNQTEISALK